MLVRSELGGHYFYFDGGALKDGQLRLVIAVPPG